MAATFVKQNLSESTNGKPIKVVAIGSPGTTIHTAVVGTSAIDEIWVYATNNQTGSVNLTLEWGTGSAADGNIKLSVPATSGLTLVAPGLLLQNNLELAAFASDANSILVTGYVNNIS